MKKELSLSQFHPSPEFLWIVSCLRLRWNPEDKSHIDLPYQKINWESVLSLINHHRVIPFVHKNLNLMKSNRPPEHIQKIIKVGYEWNAKRILKMTAELVQIFNDFKEHRIKAICLKGPALAQRLYGNLHSRKFGDLDILIHPQDIPQAGTILKNKGYKRIYPEKDLTPKQINLFMRKTHHFAYINPINKIKVEIHWQLVRTPKRLPLTFDEMWEKKESVLLGGHKIPSLSKEHTFLYLCEHGSAHAFCCLFWLCDVAEFIHQNPHENWEDIIKKARQVNVFPHTTQAVYLSHEVFQTPLPVQIAEIFQKNRSVRSLIKRSLFFMVQSKGFDFKPPTKNFWLVKIYKCQREVNLKYKLYFLVKGFFSRPKDQGRILLPDWAFPLNYILQPILLVKSFFSKKKQKDSLDQ